MATSNRTEDSERSSGTPERVRNTVAATATTSTEARLRLGRELHDNMKHIQSAHHLQHIIDNNLQVYCGYVLYLSSYTVFIVQSHGSVPATVMATMAAVQQDMGRLQKAEVLMRQVVSVEEEKFQSTGEATDLQSSLNNLALVLRDQSRHIEANELYQRAVELSTNLEHDPIMMNNMASLLQDQGDLEPAIQQYMKALRSSHAMHGPSHCDTAVIMHNLAGAYRSVGKLTESQRLYRCAVRVFEQSLGIAHPSTAAAYNGLGLTFTGNPMTSRCRCC